jgi:hypothetical protein
MVYVFNCCLADRAFERHREQALASRANSIGSSSSTAWQKPPTISDTGLLGLMPRCWQ